VDGTICPGTPICEGRKFNFLTEQYIDRLRPSLSREKCCGNPQPNSKGEEMATATQYDRATLSNIWNKAQIVTGNDPNVFRKDVYGAWMRWDKYGETSQYGWEVDHIVPVARYGSDALSNLQPLQWENNRRKGDNRW
jgi:5-methylcytosine-specific restriction endonuclease McrA